MVRAFLALASLLAVLYAVQGHPTKYRVAEPEKWLQRIRSGDMPPFYSYHIHVLYVPFENSSVHMAMEFRAKLEEHFKLVNTTPCADLDHNPRVCMFTNDPTPGSSTSPFVTAEWAVFLTLDKFEEYVTWTMQNRGDNIVFIHPNSGFQKLDHTKWALWQGDIWPLRPSVLCDSC